MSIFLLTFLIMLTAVCAMAVGVMFSGREIKGSCGGLNQFDGGSCQVCGRTEPCNN